MSPDLESPGGRVAASVEDPPAVKVSLWDLARVFGKVGSTGFGGGMSMLAMVQGEVVDRHRWVEQSEFDQSVAIGQLLPGPIAVDAITYLGYRLRGWAGAVVSVVAFILPSFLMVLALTLLYMRYGSTPLLSSAFRGLGVAVTAILFTTAWRLAKPRLRDPRSLALTAVVLVGVGVFRVNVALVVVLTALAGIVLYREP